MAKTYNHLYEKIARFDALYHAWRQARRGKRYTAAAAAFERNLDVELLMLHQELTAESWQPGGFRSFTVHEPKRRKISAAPFRDRVVHHALIYLGVSIANRHPPTPKLPYGSPAHDHTSVTSAA